MVFKFSEYNIFFIISFLLLSSIFISQDLKAAACDRDSDNDIEINSSDYLPSNDDACEFPPNIYRITFFKGGLCTADPMGTATGDIDLSSCFIFFDSSDGTAKDLESSATGTISPITLIEGGLALEINTYPYGFLILDNALEMKHVETFDTNVTGETTAGKTCWTVQKTTTMSNTTNAGTRNGKPSAAVTDGTVGTYAVECGTKTRAQADALAAFQTDIVDTMGDDCGSNFSAVLGTNGWDTIEDSHSTATLKGIMGAKLLKGDNTIASSCSDSKRIFYGIDFTNSLVITENTSTFDLSFRAKEGIEMMFNAQGTATHYTKLGSNPFQVIFTAE